ncbi:arsenosugar biosynthesis radical SAM (seleno)protein ArsS [Verrucomicrobiaceae bacterium 227]
MSSFDQKIADHGLSLSRIAPRVLQLNLGKLCNLACVHCHVNAGPHRKEMLTREDLDRTLAWFKKTSIPTLDLTGGTPEMHSGFRDLVERVRGFKQPREIITRLNATIINEPGFQWIPEFHARHGITIIASMPCYSPDNVNAQRGEGVFDSSISAFQKLNQLGYGKDPRLKMHFVYNPNGAFLPPPQDELTEDYRREMQEHFGIEFHDLYCITNMAIARYASYLKRQKKLADYQQLLVESFNPAAIDGLMCRDTISVDWRGQVYDCDFNQQLDLQLTNGGAMKIWNLNLDQLAALPIRTASHCFGCTAGAGSSCGGSLVSKEEPVA